MPISSNLSTKLLHIPWPSPFPSLSLRDMSDNTGPQHLIALRNGGCAGPRIGGAFLKKCMGETVEAGACEIAESIMLINGSKPRFLVG